ncbi:uncharacterized protein [Ptychodera flava]|uniref:uncharacterized protein n=1 Tax=Ptychodera flava TaxID=63121 RepID=UPI003969C26C
MSLKLVQSLLELIAPSQSHKLWGHIRSYDFGGSEVDNSVTITLNQPVVKAIEDASLPQMKTQLLSLVALDYTKRELLQSIKNVTVWDVDRARSHARQQGPGHLVANIPAYRPGRMPMEKVEHFMHFILQPQYTQDVAYGTRNLKLSTGESVPMPDVIRKVVIGRLISLYMRYCEEINYECLSETSLWRIGRACIASQLKSLQGLDTLTADGLAAFDKLDQIIDQIETFGQESAWCRRIRERIANGRNYLKLDYRRHLQQSSQCADHCIAYALSDPKAPKLTAQCTHDHDMMCLPCESIKTLCSDIRETLTDVNIPVHILDEVLFDLNIVSSDIEKWRAHIVRSLQQERAKHNILTLARGKDWIVVVFMDWAMKFVPQKFKETMVDFYAKRGISWHVQSFVDRLMENLV